jgi:hypothetical protein
MGVSKKRVLVAVGFLLWCMNTANPAFSDTNEQSLAGNETVMRAAEKPCTGEKLIYKITADQLSDAAQNFNDGDPLFRSLFSIFSEARKDACYYVEGKDIQKLFLTKDALDFSHSEERNGRTYYKTRGPVDEIRWLSARMRGGDIKVSSRLHRHFVRSILGSRVIEIPGVLDFTIHTFALEETEAAGGDKPPGGYRISFAYENPEEPFVSDLVAVLTGITSREMRVKQYDRKPNRREAYKTLRCLQEKGFIKVY